VKQVKDTSQTRPVHPPELGPIVAIAESAASTIDTNAGLPENLAYGTCKAARFLTREAV